MRQFPIFFKVQDRPVLLVGGGEAAAAKLRLLLKADAWVTVIAEDPLDEILDLDALVHGKTPHPDGRACPWI